MRRLMRNLVAAGVALLALAPAPALADWTLAEPVSADGNGVFPRIAVDGSGRALAIWEDTAAGDREALATRAAPASPWTAAPRLPFDLYQPEIAAYGDTRVMLVGRRTRSGSPDAMYAAFARTGGAFADFEVLDRAPRSDPVLVGPAFAAGSAGTALAAWIRDGSVRVARRTPGRAFADAETVGRGAPEQPATAADASGNVMVAWYRGGHVWARVRLAGHGWGTTHDLGTTAGRRPNTLRAAAGGAGRFAVAWSTATIADEEQRIPSTRYVRIASRDRGRWTTRLVERFRSFLDFGQVPQVAPAYNAEGSPVVIWASKSGTVAAVKSARLSSLGTPEVVSPAGHGAWLSDVAHGPDGVVVGWLDTSNFPRTLEPWAALSRTGADWSGRAALMPGARGSIGMRVAVDRDAGTPTVVWGAARDDGSQAIWASTLP